MPAHIPLAPLYERRQWVMRQMKAEFDTHDSELGAYYRSTEVRAGEERKICNVTAFSAPAQ